MRKWIDPGPRILQKDKQILIMQGYEDIKETITAKSNTVAANVNV